MPRAACPLSRGARAPRRNAPLALVDTTKYYPVVGLASWNRMCSRPHLHCELSLPGLDGHDRGAKVVARALRDAGMEVIYTGLHQTPEQIVATALAEDADAIGLSVLSGAHMTLFAKLIQLLKEADAVDIVVFGGGIIPDADREALAEMGVAQVFTPGATMSEIVAWVRANVGTGTPHLSRAGRLESLARTHPMTCGWRGGSPRAGPGWRPSAV